MVFPIDHLLFVPGINKGNGLFSQDARWPRVDLPLDTRTLAHVPGCVFEG